MSRLSILALSCFVLVAVAFVQYTEAIVTLDRICRESLNGSKSRGFVGACVGQLEACNKLKCARPKANGKGYDVVLLGWNTQEGVRCPNTVRPFTAKMCKNGQCVFPPKGKVVGGSAASSDGSIAC